VSFQGERFGTPLYSSGLSYKAIGVSKYVMFASCGVLALGLLVPVAMFLAWERNIPFPLGIGLMQLAVLLCQLLLSVSMSLRAVEAIKYARDQLCDSAGSAGPNGGEV
jgi:cytochrome c oxidase subunit IV